MPVYDLAVLGGGIAGLSVFERAARAGLDVVLLERSALGGATTAVTSALLHGGLRYLPYDVGTSYRMCREIERLRREQPELLARQSYLWPVYRGQRVGMALVESLQEYYDAFHSLRGARLHARLTAEEAARFLPGLRRDGLLGGVAFEEWRVNVPRLIASLADSGRAAGGEIRENWRAVSLATQGGRIAAALDENGARVEARVFVNAGGPWAEEIARMADVGSVSLRLRRGVHWVVPGAPPPHGLIFPGPDGRYLGVYPRDGETWVGPTDDAHDRAPDDLSVLPNEERGLRRALASVLPDLAARPGRGVVGLRPITRQRGAAFLLSRDHRIQDHAADGVDNFLTVTGGKLTTHRPLGEDVVAAASAKLGRPWTAPAGFDGDGWPWSLKRPRGRIGNLATSAALLAYFAARHALGRRAAAPFAEYER